MDCQLCGPQSFVQAQNQANVAADKLPYLDEKYRTIEPGFNCGQHLITQGLF